MSLVQSAKSGDQLQTLKDLRDELAEAIASARCSDCGALSGPTLAALSSRLVDVLGQITALGGGQTKGKTPKDEVDERRRRRLAGA